MAVGRLRRRTDAVKSTEDDGEMVLECTLSQVELPQKAGPSPDGARRANPPALADLRHSQSPHKGAQPQRKAAWLLKVRLNTCHVDTGAPWRLSDTTSESCSAHVAWLLEGT
jgi:hypothetical protein